MFFKRCRLLLKRIYNSIIMFNQDSLAAAQIAQIFGSELLKVQNSARTDGGSTPQIVKMDPKQFLVGQPQYVAAQRAEEQRIIQALQREAEAAYPVPQTEQYVPPSAPTSLPPEVAPTRTAASRPRVDEFVSVPSLDVLERIASSLERIANAVDKSPKKKIVKRKIKSGKSVMLNENHA